MSPLLAQSGHSREANQCPLLRVKQTLAGIAVMSAFDSKRTFIATFILFHLTMYDALEHLEDQ